MYQKHEMDIIPYEENVYVVCSYTYGGDTGWSVDSINPGSKDSQRENDMYEKHSMNIVLFTSKDVFADYWDGSTVEGDDEDQWSLKPNRSDI